MLIGIDDRQERIPASGYDGGAPDGGPCPPGEVLATNGACQPAGIPDAACALGCHDLGPCGTGDYGDIAVSADTQFVNAAYPGSDSDGTEQRPWTAIQRGIGAAAPGATIATAEGSYPEHVVVVNKKVDVRGRCPSLVHIVGDEEGAATATVEVLYGAQGSSLAGEGGVTVDDDLAAAGVKWSDSLVEIATGNNVSVRSADVELNHIAIRRTRAPPDAPDPPEGYD